MAATVNEVAQQLERKSKEYQEFLEKHKTEMVDENNRPIFDMDTSAVQESIRRNEELNDLGRKLDGLRTAEAWSVNEDRMQELKGIDRATPRPVVAAAGGNDDSYARRSFLNDRKSLGEMVVDHKDYRYRNVGSKNFSVEFPDYDVKTLLSIGAGYTPPNYRTDLVVPYANRKPVVADLIPTDETMLQIVKWMEETTFTNSAATVSEGAAKPESALLWTEKSAVVQKIATWIPVTEEQVDDVPGFQGLINNNLVLMLQLVEETQLLTGSGNSPDLLGFLNHPSIQSQARSSDDNQDAIFKAFTLVRWTGFANPTGVVIHPTNWQAIRLQRTTQGLYIFGNPGESGVDTLFGVPVIVTSAITLNTALTGDFRMFSHISRRLGIRVDVANQHDTYFVYNKLAVRAEMRESLEIRRGAAFCKVTGLN